MLTIVRPPSALPALPAPSSSPSAPPSSALPLTIFLSGTLNPLSPWKDSLVRALRSYLSSFSSSSASTSSPRHLNVVDPFNPAWDASWHPTPAFAPFRHQTEWEFDMMERCDPLVVRFDGGAGHMISDSEAKREDNGAEGDEEGEGERVENSIDAEEKREMEAAMSKTESRGCPVSLMEMALFVGRLYGWTERSTRYGLDSIQSPTGKRVVVCCPDDFWVRGNVEMLCQRYGMCGVKFVSKATDLDAAVVRDVQELMGA